MSSLTTALRTKLTYTRSEKKAAPDAVESWRQRLSRALGITAKVEAPSDLKITSTQHRMGQLSMLDISSSAHAFTATPGGNDDVIVWLKAKGHGAVSQHGRHAKMAPATLCLCETRQAFSAQFDTPSRDILLTLPARMLRDAMPNWDAVILQAISAAEGAAALFADLVMSLAEHAPDLSVSCAGETSDSVCALLIATLRALPQNQAALPSPLETYHRDRIRGYVREQLRDPTLSMASVAQATGLSRRYIHRLFSKEPVPLMKWVWSERLDHCCRDLGLEALRNRTVSEIAFFWGFNNAAHFSRAFRERFGAAPSVFRKRALNGEAARLAPADH